jgi:YQGE family putative transporter
MGPALSGFLIAMFEGLTGYIVTFSIACVMFAIASVFSTKIPQTDTTKRTFYMKFSRTMMKREPTWVKSLFCFFLMGLFQGIMLFLPNILLFQAVAREERVGLLTVLFSLLTIATGFYVSRRKRHIRVKSELFYSSLVVAAASGLLFIGIRWWTVVGFMVVFSLFNPLTINTLTSYYYRMMDFLPLRGHFRIESVVLREWFLNAGRVISILILILFAGDPESSALPLVLIAAASLQMGMVLLVKNQTAETPNNRKKAVSPRT